MRKLQISTYTAYSVACFACFVVSAVFYVFAYTQTVLYLIPAGLMGFLGVVFLGLSLNEKR